MELNEHHYKKSRRVGSSYNVYIIKNFSIFIPKSKNQFYLRVIFIAIFDVEINSGYLKKTDYFLSQNANLMVSHTKQQRANKFKYDNWIS
jgi:hypothetical protein